MNPQSPRLGLIGLLLCLSSLFTVLAADDADPLAEALLALRGVEPTYEKLSLLYGLRSKATSAEVANATVHACAAGLIYLGRTDVYYGKVRATVTEVPEFEAILSQPCGTCDGAKEVTERCDKCRGRGACDNARCVGGNVPAPSMGGGSSTRRCAVCNGTGACPQCRGARTETRKCQKCQATGMTFVKSRALAIYRQAIDVALGNMIAVEHESRTREAELAARQEAILLAAETKAKQEARRAEDKELDARYGDHDKKYLPQVVLLQGDRGNGTGFLCEFKGKKVVFSNAHVLCGNRELEMKTVDNKVIDFDAIKVSKTRDIVAYIITEADKYQYLTVQEEVATSALNANIVIFGNSGGQGVVTRLRGQVNGIGPDILEVSAEFVPGNSGSPVISYESGKVIGLATYVTMQRETDWTTDRTRFAEVRRFAVRLDDLTWDDFFDLDGTEYEATLDQFDKIVAFANDILKRAMTTRNFKPSAIEKREAKELLDQYEKLPEWMRKSADDAMIGSRICQSLLEL